MSSTYHYNGTSGQKNTGEIDEESTVPDHVSTATFRHCSEQLFPVLTDLFNPLTVEKNGR